VYLFIYVVQDFCQSHMNMKLQGRSVLEQTITPCMYVCIHTHTHVSEQIFILSQRMNVLLDQTNTLVIYACMHAYANTYIHPHNVWTNCWIRLIHSSYMYMHACILQHVHTPSQRMNKLLDQTNTLVTYACMHTHIHTHRAAPHAATSRSRVYIHTYTQKNRHTYTHTYIHTHSCASCGNS
jgi:hypothetical protein